MNDRQRLFAEEFAVDFNATQAAIRAGYSERTAGSIGSENLKKPEIYALVEEAVRERIRRTHVTQDRVVLEAAGIAFDRERPDAVRLKALELLGKLLGMFREREKETDGGGGGVVLLPPVMEPVEGDEA